MSIEAIQENETTIHYLNREIDIWGDDDRQKDRDYWKGYTVALMEVRTHLENRNRKLWKPIVESTEKMIREGM